MKIKYSFLIDQKFFDEWYKEFKIYKSKTDKSQDVKFLVNLIEEFFNTAIQDRVIVTKYNAFQEDLYNQYINYIKNQIYKILPLMEERGEWRKHLDTLITELNGSDKVFLHTINFISLINKLEMLKECPDFNISLSLENIQETEKFKIFRKTIFECMNIAESLVAAGDQNDK